MKPVLAAAILVLCISATAMGAVPTSIDVQGRLTDSSGSPFPVGDENVTFEIFDAQIDGTNLWAEDQTISILANGLWIAALGSVTPLTDTVFQDSVRWLKVTLSDGTSLPRIRFATGPYAHRVSTVAGASGGTITSSVGILEPTPTSTLHLGGPVATPIRTATSETTIGPNDSVVLVTAGFDVTLPDAAICRGRQYMIKKIAAGANVFIKVSPGSGDAIEGAVQHILQVQDQSVTIVSDGADNWFVID